MWAVSMQVRTLLLMPGCGPDKGDTERGRRGWGIAAHCSAGADPMLPPHRQGRPSKSSINAFIVASLPQLNFSRRMVRCSETILPREKPQPSL
ncbi:unnamed protein product [Victoria cruziana]